jgi:hypothetical protein
MTCSDCGSCLDDVPIGRPCPNCAGLRRDARVMAQTAEVRVVALRPTIAIGYNEHRPWRQKWQDLSLALEQLEGAYATEEGQGNEHIRRMVEDFFETCRELADWLWQDKQNANVTKSAAMGFVMGDRHLRLADAMAQTTKHHTRQGSDPITARITEIRVGPDGARAQIGWSRVSGENGSEDALDLARSCVGAWRGFLLHNRTITTSPP